MAGGLSNQLKYAAELEIRTIDNNCHFIDYSLAFLLLFAFSSRMGLFIWEVFDVHLLSTFKPQDFYQLSTSYSAVFIHFGEYLLPCLDQGDVRSISLFFENTADNTAAVHDEAVNV